MTEQQNTAEVLHNVKTQKKHFFMAFVGAALDGDIVAQINTLCPSDTRLVAARHLTIIQMNASSVFAEMGIEGVEPIIQNLFYLGEGTEAEFFAGTQISPEEITRQQQEASQRIYGEPAVEAEEGAPLELAEGELAPEV